MKSSLILSLCALLGVPDGALTFAQDEIPASLPEVDPAAEGANPEGEAIAEELLTLMEDVKANGATFEKLDKMGDLYLRSGDARRAMLVFEMAIADFGGTEALFLKIARVMRIVGGPEAALNALNLGLETFPESELLAYEIGKTYVDLNKPYAAVSNFKKVLARQPEKELYRYHLAAAYRLQGKWEEASELIDVLVDEQSGILEVYLMKGELLIAQGELSDGVRFLEDLLSEHPESDGVNQVLVNAYQLYAYTEAQSGRLDGAVQGVRRALEVEPKDGRSQMALASYLNELGDYEEAESTFKALLQQNPNHLDAYVFYGQMLESLERTPEAAEQYQKGLSKARELGAQGPIDAFRQLLRIKP